MYKRIIRIVALSLLLAAVTLLCLGAILGLLFGYLNIEGEEIWSLFVRTPSRGNGVLTLLIATIAIFLWWRCSARIGDDAFWLMYHWKKRSRDGKK